MVVWYIQIRLRGNWNTLTSEYFGTRDEAEWAIALWKQQNQCLGDDDFRTISVEVK